jgi:hypothetical protein
VVGAISVCSMVMKGCLAVLLLAACTTTNPTVHVERQSSPLASATSDGWIAGSAVVVGAPGTFVFPQALSLRILLVDRDEEPGDDGTRAPLSVQSATVTAYGDSSFDVVTPPDCEPSACAAELRITGFGTNVIQIVATGEGGAHTACVYFGVHEDADPDAASAGLRDEAEAEQAACKQSLRQ